MQPSPDRALPTAADVDAAARRLAGVALHTPLVTSPVLDALTGARVFLKAETLQRTGSFKFRGAYNKLSTIPQAEGAEVVLYDRAREDRQAIAQEIAQKRHAALVPPYDDALIIAGQGTAGREIV